MVSSWLAGGPWDWLFVALLLAVPAGVVAYDCVAERRRGERLAQAAGELGLRFEREGDPTFLRPLGEFHLFSRGHAPRVRNLMQGAHGGHDVALFDYTYTTGAGKHRRTWRQTVLRVRLAGAALPLFCLCPESIWHRIGEWFGAQDIDFEGWPDFSAHYLLRGPDEAAIRGFFAGRVLGFFSRESGLSVEGCGESVLFYRHDVREEPAELGSFLREGCEVAALFLAGAGASPIGSA